MDWAIRFGESVSAITRSKSENPFLNPSHPTGYVHRERFLTIPLPTSSGRKRKPAAKYLTDTIIIRASNGHRTCIMRQHLHPEQTQLSAAEIFCLVALSIESQLENPAMQFYSVSRSP